MKLSMASHQVAVAKAAFSAGLLRPDPVSTPRDSIEQFHVLLNNTINQCSPKNVQKCKYWILDNIVQSTARCTALGKYLNALASSFRTASKEQGQPSGKRRCLHILYLVNDVLYHGKYNGNDASLAGKFQGILMDLVGSTASFKDCPKHQSKVSHLLGLWQEKDYYSANYVDKLREAANNAATGEEIARSTNDGTEGLADSKATKNAPYIMPASHGDSSTPWFDLPAANLMPHIVPNSTKALNPDSIRPLQLVAGPADETLVNAVKSLLEDVGTIFGEADFVDKEEWDVDELGQSIELDEITGEILAGEGYYGWSRKFCENMKRKKNGLDVPGQEDIRGRDSRSRSRSSSRSIRKRRYSNSSEESDRDRKDRRRRRSYTSSRSPTPQRERGAQSRDMSRSRDGVRRRSVSPQRNGFHAEGQSGSLPVQNQPQAFPPFPPQPSMGFPAPPPLPFQQGFSSHLPPPPIPPNLAYNNGYNNASFNGAPFNGQSQPLWPPPPPPPNMPMNTPQNWPPPPPPGGPPPPQMYQQNTNQQYPGNFTPSAPGDWQQQQQQQQQQQNQHHQQYAGGGYNQNSGWNNNSANRGRGSFRGRGRGW